MNYLEILYLLLISTSGYLFLNYLCKQPQPLSISLSLPVGSVVFVIFILLFFMRYFIAYAIFWSILICFSVYSSHRKTTDQISNKKTLHSKLYISLFVASTIAMLAIFSGKSFLVLSFDSKGMIFFGNVIESFGYIPEAFLKFTARPVGGNLSLRPVFLPMLQAGSAFFDLNYSAAYFPLCFLSLNFLLWYCLTTLTHHMKKTGKAWTCMYWTGLIAVYASCPFVFWSAFYYNGHTLSAIFFLCFTFGAIMATRTEARPYFFLITVAATGAMLVRLENFIVIPIWLLVIAASTSINIENLWYSYLSTFLIIAPWPVFLFIYGEQTFFFAPLKFIIIVIALLAPLIVLPFLKNYRLKHLFEVCTGVFIVVSITTGFIVKPQYSLDCIKTTWANIVPGGNWGYLQIFLLTSAVLWMPFIKIASEYTRMLGKLILIYLAFQFLTYYTYPPFYMWSDSTNRMLLHICPMAMLFFGLIYDDMHARRHQEPADFK